MRILLSNSSPEPIYEQIARQVRTQIISGELQEGALLPSIRALAHALQISVITTKRAYEELEKEGLFDTVGGKGTFVAAQNPGAAWRYRPRDGESDTSVTVWAALALAAAREVGVSVPASLNTPVPLILVHTEGGKTAFTTLASPIVTAPEPSQVSTSLPALASGA